MSDLLAFNDDGELCFDADGAAVDVDCCGGGGNCCDIPPWEPGSCYGSPECLPSGEVSGCCSPSQSPCVALPGSIATIMVTDLVLRHTDPDGSVSRQYVGPPEIVMQATVDGCGSFVASADGSDWWYRRAPDPNPPVYAYCEVVVSWNRGSLSSGPRIILTINPDDALSGLTLRWISGAGSCFGPLFEQSCDVQAYGACNSGIDGTYTGASGAFTVLGTGRAAIQSGIGLCPGAAPLSVPAAPCPGCNDRRSTDGF